MSLFANIDGAVEELRAVHLAATSIDCNTLTNPYLSRLLLASEATAAHALRVFLSPTEILPDLATQDERDALDEAGTPWVEEPGYDLESDFFSGERWGYLVTRHKPVIAVHSMRFVYPQPYSSVFDVPHDWLRIDKKYGHIRLVPGSQAIAAPLSAWVMQVLAAGRTVPQMIQLRYTAGISDAATRYPDLTDLVYRMAALRALRGIILPQSESISADGLSQSRSQDLDKHQEGIDAELERLRQVIHGVQMMVF